MGALRIRKLLTVPEPLTAIHISHMDGAMTVNKKFPRHQQSSLQLAEASNVVLTYLAEKYRVFAHRYHFFFTSQNWTKNTKS